MKKMMLLMLLLLGLGTASVNAQVRIGLSNDPHEGAILDLSEAPSGAKLGLLLPRVELTDLTTLQMGGSSAEEDQAAKGMLVFNTVAKTTPVAIPVGLYVWDGKDWKPALLF
ncbi:hypothetical protein FACS189437_07520 [Bacteroidia bacterium]|nr:hypothetical protein FACS189437_07520 [Bacteroidia bacterium]